MLKQFKPKKTGGRTKKLVDDMRKHNSKVNKKKEESDSEVSDVSDSEDSEYEELLISSIVNKTKIEDKKEDKKLDVKEEKKDEVLPPPLPLERVNSSKPIDIKPKKKGRKTVIIKKYYQKREPKTTPTPATQPAPQPTKEVKLNYLGLPMTQANNNDTTRNHITNRIFNW